VKVVKLATMLERDQGQIKDMLDRLQRLQAEGNLQEVAVFYMDSEGTARAMMSDSLRMSSLAFGIEYLRAHLQNWIQR
jgi:hypothetical protein